MSAIRLRGATSGTTDVVAAAIAGDGVMTLPSGTGTLATTAFVNTAVAAGGKVLQVVRGTDSTDRTTTSSSFVDAGISVTITPQRTTSNILLIWTANTSATVTSGTNCFARFAITDSANNLIGGQVRLGIAASAANNQIDSAMSLIRWASPATVSATTYKGRFNLQFGLNANVFNNTTGAGELFAIEVAA